MAGRRHGMLPASRGRMTIAWQPNAEGRLAPYIRGREDVHVAWAPQPGSQEAFLSCPVTEALIEGNTGGGKTDALLMDFAQFVGRGFGRDWCGILFRRAFTELGDIIGKSLHWFSQIFPKATYNQQAHEWRFPDGETLRFGYMDSEVDYYRYHGFSFSWIGWEELTNWKSLACYTRMFSRLRTTNPRVPLHVRAACNPGGPGHNLVKKRFGLPIPRGQIVGPIIHSVDEKGRPLPDRVAIRSRLAENQIALNADPGYEGRVVASADTPERRAAWVDGDWDIKAGGIIDDLWDEQYHAVPPLPPALVPRAWRMDRCFDDGYSKPFSVGWWARSNGEPVEWEGGLIGTIPGDMIRVEEWYGWTGTENEGLNMGTVEKTRGILDREMNWGIRGRVRPGPADNSIFDADKRDPSKSIAGEMASLGVSWLRSDKSPGSRKLGWKTLRDMLTAAIPVNGRREKPGVFVSRRCVQFLRVMPTLQRDPKDTDDVNTNDEDHIGDETRYALLRPRAIETEQRAPIY
jgi:hypothetical protein